MLRPIFVLLLLIGAHKNCQASTQNSVPPQPYTGYISDNLYTYSRSGPGKEFRFIARLKAGEQVQITNNTKNDFTEIIDHNNRHGWIDNRYITTKETFRYKINQLEEAKLAAEMAAQKALATAKNMHQDLIQKKVDLTAKLKATTFKLQKVSDELNASQKARYHTEKQLHQLQGQQRTQMWLQGGLIASAGLVLGLIIPYLPSPNKRKSKRWMS